MEITNNTQGLNQTTTTSNKSVTLAIKSTNTFGSTTTTISSTHSSINKFIYDKNSGDTFTSISSSLKDVPASYEPTYGVASTTGTSTYSPASTFSAVGGDGTTNLNALQLSMWNGYFYSRNGWQSATSINTGNCSNWNIPNSLPTFSGADSEYKWAIFHYTLTPSATFAPYKVLCVLGNTTNITNSNLKNSSLSAKVYFYNGTPNNNYYWFNISQDAPGLTDSIANGGNFSYGGEGTNGYEGSGDSTLASTTDTNFNNSSDIAGTGKFTEAFNPIPNRIIGARFNKISIGGGATKDFYIAIGLKNDSNLYVKKPELYLASGTSASQTQQAN